MAEVFRPTYTELDPKTGKRRTKKSKTWWIRFYLPSGERKKVKGYKDRKATETYAAELERKAARVDSGFTDPLDEHALRPLLEHAEDYRRYLTAKGNTAAHVKKTLGRILASLAGCRFVKLTDIQPSAVVEFLAALRTPTKGENGDIAEKGKGIQTANYYLTAVRGFTRWLWKDKRAAVDPLAGMSKLANAETDVRRVRRDYTPEELRELIEATAASKRDFRGLPGLERSKLYLTAAGTGLRVSELASLTPASFNLDATPPAVRLQAAYAKNRKDAEQPLPAELATALRPFLNGKAEDALLWPGKWHEQSALMIRQDQEQARKAWLENVQDAQKRAAMHRSDFLTYEDSEGRTIDFHSLRHTYISRIVQSGASAKTAQTLARHSTVQLTLGRYAHSSVYDLTAAVGSLPSLLPQDKKSKTMAATGTDGRGNDQKNLGPNLGLSRAKKGNFVRLAETESGDDEEGPAKQETPEKSGISCESPSGHGGTRTHTGITPQGILSPQDDCHKPLTYKEVVDEYRKTLAQSLAQNPKNAPADSDLARVLEAWPNLPDAIRRAVMALINSVI